jgi:hypothetical protein
VSVGDQSPNGLAISFDKAGVTFLGTPAAMIDNAGGRRKFSCALNEIVCNNHFGLSYLALKVL